MTLAVTDYERSHYTIEHGHTSIGYYAALSALGFLDRRSRHRRLPPRPRHRRSRLVGARRHRAELRPPRRDVPGRHRARARTEGAPRRRAAHVICHTGDAGWISGQALNGLNAAAVHRAPITFVMHRNGIQLSGTTRHIMNQDPRAIVASFGVKILEIRSLHDRRAAVRRLSRSVPQRAERPADADLSDRVGARGRRSAGDGRGVRPKVRHRRGDARSSPTEHERAARSRRSGFPDRS